MVKQYDLVALLGRTVKDLQYATTELPVPQCRNQDGQFPISRQMCITWFIILFPTQVLPLFQFLLLKHVGSRSF